MIESDKRCGTCGEALFLKEFRGAEVLVCQTCGTVTLSKQDFKVLLTARRSPDPQPEPAHLPYDLPPPTPSGPRAMLGLGDRSGRYDEVRYIEEDESFMDTEETEEFPREPELGTMFETEVEIPATDEAPLIEPTSDGPVIAPNAKTPIVEARTEPRFEPSAVAPPPSRGPSLSVEPPVADSFDDDMFVAYRRDRRRSMFFAVFVAFLALGGVGVAVAVLTLGDLMGAGSPDLGPRLPGIPADEEPAGPQVPDGFVPEPAAPAAPAPEPDPSESESPPTDASAEPDPSEDPAVAPQPGPVQPSAASLAREGWQTLESSPQEAERIFLRALDLDPGHADANYGYGYALLKLGRATRATPYLCKAQQSGGEEIGREVRALMTQNGLSCE